MKNGSIKRLSLTSSYTFYLQTCKSYITKSTFYIIRTFLIPIVPQLRLHVQLRLNLLRNNSPLRPDKATASQFFTFSALKPTWTLSVDFVLRRPSRSVRINVEHCVLVQVYSPENPPEKKVRSSRFGKTTVNSQALKSRKTMKTQFLYKNF